MKKRPFLESFGIFKHPKFELHLLIELIMNILSIIPIIGLFELFNYPLLEYEKIAGVVIYIIGVTLIVESLKIYIIRHFIDYIIKTRGLFFLCLYAVIFYLLTFLIKDLSFTPIVIVNILIFTTIFLIFKILLIIVYQRMQNTDKKGEE